MDTTLKKLDNKNNMKSAQFCGYALDAIYKRQFVMFKETNVLTRIIDSKEMKMPIEYLQAITNDWRHWIPKSINVCRHLPLFRLERIRVYECYAVPNDTEIIRGALVLKICVDPDKESGWRCE